MNNQPIGIIDSGFGGLSVWREIISSLPQESIVYLADSKNCPYGEKTSEEIYQLAYRMVDFLLSKQVKLIVIACNTVTVTSLEKLRFAFSQVPILGIVPVIKTAAEISKKKKIGILATTATAKSQFQKDLIQKWAKGFEVVNMGTNKLAPFIEKGELESKSLNKVLQEVLNPFIEKEVDVIALGCSHYPFLRTLIKNILGEKVMLIDSGAAIARQTKRVLENNQDFSSDKKPFYLFYTTGEVKHFVGVARQLLSENGSEKIRDVHHIVLDAV